MKTSLTILFLAFFQLNCYSQDTFTSRKGSRFFPGHLDIVITVDDKNLRYELFNHWYTASYAEYRQLIIPLDSLHHFNQQSDSIHIKLGKGAVKLTDKRYRISKKEKQNRNH